MHTALYQAKLYHIGTKLRLGMGVVPILRMPNRSSYCAYCFVPSNIVPHWHQIETWYGGCTNSQNAKPILILGILSFYWQGTGTRPDTVMVNLTWILYRHFHIKPIKAQFSWHCQFQPWCPKKLVKDGWIHGRISMSSMILINVETELLTVTQDIILADCCR